jgi:hypothetical protein
MQLLCLFFPFHPFIRHCSSTVNYTCNFIIYLTYIVGSEEEGKDGSENNCHDNYDEAGN